MLIGNSMNVLIKCPRDVDEGTKVVTFEVLSLYANNPCEFGLEALDYFLTTYQEDLNPRFKKELALELANFTVKGNTLTFDSEFYLQIKQAANDTVFAPTYANLNMRY